MIGSKLGLAMGFTPTSPPQDVGAVDKIALPLAFGQTPLVEEGQAVEIGEMVAGSCGGAAAIHASISGTVVKIGNQNCHFGRIAPTIFIENDGENRLCLASPKAILRDESKLELLELLDNRGVTDQEGRSLAVVLAARLSPISTLILCGMDREPFLTTEDGALCFCGEDVLSGMRILQRITVARETVVALSAHQKTAIDQVSGWVGRGLRVAVTAGHYPHGDPKLLAQLVGACDLEEELEEAGVLVVSATAAMNVARAIYGGRGITRNLVTVANDKSAILLDVPIGISTKKLLDFAGYAGETVILGGPMQGTVLQDLEVPISPGVGGISLLRQVAGVSPTACIRCGNCAEVCPVGLRPYARRGGKTVHWNRCLHCGACQYVCPAGRLGQPTKEVATVG
ncbi:MAG: 4Fe-4S binding protein [Eubacteriales bacterium]